MNPTQTKILLAARPEGLPKSDDFEIVAAPIPTPADGEVLVRSIYLSLDPAMRGWMNEGKSYIEPMASRSARSSRRRIRPSSPARRSAG